MKLLDNVALYLDDSCPLCRSRTGVYDCGGEWALPPGGWSRLLAIAQAHGWDRAGTEPPVYEPEYFGDDPEVNPEAYWHGDPSEWDGRYFSGYGQAVNPAGAEVNFDAGPRPGDRAVNTTSTTEENMKKLNMGTDMDKDKDKRSPVMDEDGPVTMVSDLAKFKGPVALTISDWTEIFYAVEGKIAELRGDLKGAVKVYAQNVEERKAAGDESGVEGEEGDIDSPVFLRKWIAQMEQIQATIGVDGIIGAARGVKGAPAKEVKALVRGYFEAAYEENLRTMDADHAAAMAESQAKKRQQRAAEP